MLGRIVFLLAVFYCSPNGSMGQDTPVPDTINIKSENLKLGALLFKPAGRGPYPAILFAHGSHSRQDTLNDILKDISVMGRFFAGQGWIFLGLCRRGVGLSEGQGTRRGDLMNMAFQKEGQVARNKIQLQIMEGGESVDLNSGMNYLLLSKDVDPNQVVLAGHSFGASLGFIFASQNKNLKAALLFSPGGYSWNLSAPLRDRLMRAADEIKIPVMIVHAENDYSTNPGLALDSLMNMLNKIHLLKIYPKFGLTTSEGHRIIFDAIKLWEMDLFQFPEAHVRKRKS